MSSISSGPDSGGLAEALWTIVSTDGSVSDNSVIVPSDTQSNSDHVDGVSSRSGTPQHLVFPVMSGNNDPSVEANTASEINSPYPHPIFPGLEIQSRSAGASSQDQNPPKYQDIVPSSNENAHQPLSRSYDGANIRYKENLSFFGISWSIEHAIEGATTSAVLTIFSSLKKPMLMSALGAKKLFLASCVGSGATLAAVGGYYLYDSYAHPKIEQKPPEPRKVFGYFDERAVNDLNLVLTLTATFFASAYFTLKIMKKISKHLPEDFSLKKYFFRDITKEKEVS